MRFIEGDPPPNQARRDYAIVRRLVAQLRENEDVWAELDADESASLQRMGGSWRVEYYVDDSGRCWARSVPPPPDPGMPRLRPDNTEWDRPRRSWWRRDR